MNLIVACDPAGGIGYCNKLPWNKIQGDLPRFKKLTENGIVVMGRNTWESLPKKPLQNRLNFVLTSRSIELPQSTFAIGSLEDLKNISNVWLIGGSKVINDSWDYIGTVHLTRTFATYTCDAYIDLLNLQKNYTLSYEEVNSDHTYEIWVKR